MVETFTKRTVQDSGQGQEYLRVSYNEDAFGASVGRALTQLGNTGQQLGNNLKILADTKKANDVTNRLNEAKDELRPKFFDPDNGIYARQGGRAMGAGLEAKQAYDDAQKKYIDGLKDPQERELFQKLWDRERESALDKTAVHEMTELGAYKAQTAKSTLLTAVTDAYDNYNDPKAVERAINTAESVINMNSMGLPPEAVAAAREEARSQITLAAISRWAGEDPYKALDYYQANKDKLSGKDHITANSLIGAARDAKDAQADYERITKTGGAAATDLWSRLEQAESGGDNNAVSEDGAVSVAQLTPETARGLLYQSGMADAHSLSDSQVKKILQDDRNLARRLGKTYLNEQINRFSGDVEAALVAYNAGPARAEAFLKHNAGKPPGERDYDIPGMKFLKNETEPYVNKILGRSGNRQQTPAGYRMTDSNWSLKNFQPDDLMAPTAAGRWVDARAAQSLDELATVMGQRFPGLRVSVNEKNDNPSTAGKRRGTSDPADNPHVKKSKHLEGNAFDVQIQSWSDEQKAAFVSEARKLGFKGFGFYGINGHLHIDMGNERTWGPVPDWAQGPLKEAVGVVPEASGESAAPVSDGLPASGSGLYGLGAQAPGGAFVSTKAPDLNAWLAEAQTIADPGRRERVIAMLRAGAAQQEQDNKAAVAQLKQSAWESVLSPGGSVKDLPIHIQAQLGPEFLGQLSTFEANRNKRDMPMDWQAWASVPTDPKQLAEMDVYSEYRNKLDDEHFDRLLTLQREAINKSQGKQADEDLLANQRTSSQILTDAFQAQGWKTNNAGNAKLMQSFASRFDSLVLGAQQQKGGKLNSVELQDIADKLLIEDKYSSFGFGSQGMAAQVKEPDDFIAASEWSEVQPDDQKVLVEQFELYMGKAPNQEEATDIYNRAMRVFLGGTPDGPDEEKDLLRQKLETRLKRPLSDQEFNKHYGTYLRSFLSGRTR